jgi:hypothetical protein
MRGAALAVVAVMVASVAVGQTKVRFCDLLHAPETYNGKQVTVRATFRYGFEWQQLYCLDCLEKGKAWLELPSDLDEMSLKALKHAPKNAGIVNITVQGTFKSGGSFGHLNGYRYELVAEKVSDVKVVLKGMKGPVEERKAEQKWACGGTNPK